MVSRLLLEHHTLSRDFILFCVQQIIIVSGDADLMSNAELSRDRPQVYNFPFATGLFNWLDYDVFPMNTSRPEAKDKRVKVSTNEVAVLKIIYVWVLPVLLAICGSVLLIRRKRK